MQGQPMIILDEEAQRMKDDDAQSHNISAARAVAQSVRSTLGPKGMDKMLVSSIGDVTITNDGVTILQEMDIENPTAEMIIEVAEAQEDEAGDGTTTAVAIAGELLKNAEELLDQDIHPTAIIRGFDMAVKQARNEMNDIAESVEPDDEDVLKAVAETSMTGKGAELNLDLLSDLVVGAVQAVSVEGQDGSTIVDLEYVDIEPKAGRPAADSKLIEGAVIDEDPAHEDMPTDVDDASILLTDTALELEETEADAQLSVDDPDQLQDFIEQEEQQLREMVDTIAASGADVVFCQNGIDDMVKHLLAREGILAIERATMGDIEFLKEIVDARIVSDLDSVTVGDLGTGDVARDAEEGWFTVQGDGHGVTLLIRGSTEHVADELERGINDALDVVSSTVSDGRVLSGGGAIEVELASRIRDYADSVSGREQLAIEAFADAFELVPRVLAENAGLDPIDTLVDLRSAHENGETRAGLNVFTGDVVDTYEDGVIEPAHAKSQALSSAAEAANLVLKIDDIIQAEQTEGGEGGPGGAPGGMGGMGGGMGGMM
ncbi:MAG: thermosome subunit beta [Halorhabdus sp.]